MQRAQPARILPRPKLARLRPLLWTCALWLAGCSGAETANLPTTDGRAVTVPLATTQHVRVTPPKGCKVAQPDLWVCQHGPDRVTILRVARLAEPEDGSDAYLDRLVRDLGKNGQADVERDERIALGDLEARRIDAVALREKPPTAIWLVAVAAEDGLYTVSVAGLASDLRDKSKDYDAFLQSLRITTASGATPRQPGSADLLPESEAELAPAGGTDEADGTDTDSEAGTEP